MQTQQATHVSLTEAIRRELNNLIPNQIFTVKDLTTWIRDKVNCGSLTITEISLNDRWQPQYEHMVHGQVVFERQSVSYEHVKREFLALTDDEYFGRFSVVPGISQAFKTYKVNNAKQEDPLAPVVAQEDPLAVVAVVTSQLAQNAAQHNADNWRKNLDTAFLDTVVVGQAQSHTVSTQIKNIRSVEDILIRKPTHTFEVWYMGNRLTLGGQRSFIEKPEAIEAVKELLGKVYDDYKFVTKEVNRLLKSKRLEIYKIKL